MDEIRQVHDAKTFCLLRATAHSSKRVIATAKPSVWPSVCAGIVHRWMKIGSCGIRCKVAKHSSFLTPTMVKVTHPSEKRRLRSMSAYNVSTVKASKKVQLSRIGNRPRAFQWAVDEVCYPYLSQKVARKGNVSFLAERCYCIASSAIHIRCCLSSVVVYDASVLWQDGWS